MVRRAINATGYLLSVLLVIAAAGCATTASPVGSTSKQTDQIALKEGGPHSKKWESKDVVLTFTYTWKSDSIQLEGTADLTPRLTKAFIEVRKLAILANLMDQDKVILASESIVLSGRRPIDTFRFNRSMDLPPGTVGLNFSYAGTVIDAGTDWIDMNFWRVP